MIINCLSNGNSIRLGGHAHGIVTKTAHKTLPGGGGEVGGIWWSVSGWWGWGLGVGVGGGVGSTELWHGGLQSCRVGFLGPFDRTCQNFGGGGSRDGGLGGGGGQGVHI